jgi:ubiquinone/menaquinone biosynthesis C-methylase UbiE
VTRYDHPWFASWYPRLAAATDRAGFAGRRAALLAGLSGTVVELGAGSGQNFAHYPAGVTRLVAVEPEATLRAKARAAAPAVAVPVEFVGAAAENLPFADASVDTVVSSLMLCSVADQSAVLAEIRRVLRPGGRFRFLEHVISAKPYAAAGQRFLDATYLWTLIGAGCHCARDTATALFDAGFDVKSLERFVFPDRGLRRPTAPHIIGEAVRPA